MNGSFGRSIGPSSRYTILAANVSKVLSDARDRTVDETEKRVMTRAAELLRNIIEGSKFVERKEAHALSNPSESLFAASHAIAALQSLNDAGEQAAQVTTVFEAFEADLRSIAAGEDVPATRLSSLAKFFDALRSFFYRDIADVAAPQREPLFEKPVGN